MHIHKHHVNFFSAFFQQSQFVRFAKVHPAVLFGYEIDPVKYMRQIGVIEIAGGILLVGPRIFKMFSCLMLSSIMIGAMYTLHQLKEPMSKIAAPAIVLLLLFLRLHFLLIGNVKEHSAQKTEKKE